jgi:hypothetical protein
MKIKNLKEIRLRSGMVVFLLFFGIAFIEAFRTRNWIAVAYWVGIASLFLLLDNGTRDEHYDQEKL